MRSIWDGLNLAQRLQKTLGVLFKIPMTFQTDLLDQVSLPGLLLFLLVGIYELAMRIPKFFFILLLTSVCSAESTKTIFNPFTQKLDYITRIDTGTVINGSSYRTVDANSCLWDITVNITGNLVTTLVSCPVVTAFVPCTPGVPYGVLLGLTCPRP